MTLDLTKPVQTRDGRPARIICTDRKGAGSIIALITMRDGTEVPWACLEDGAQARGVSTPEDLINAPVKREGWVKVLRNAAGVFFLDSILYATEEDAERAPLHGWNERVACIPVEWEEPS